MKTLIKVFFSLALIFLMGCNTKIETPPSVNNIEDYKGDVTYINGSDCKNWEVFGEFNYDNKTSFLNHNFSTMAELRGYCDISIDPYVHVCESSKLSKELDSKNFTFAWLNCTDKGEGYYIRKKLEITI